MSTLLKVLGSPVSIVVLIGSIIIATINVVQKANGSLPASTYFENREQDSLRGFYESGATRAQLTEIQTQIADVRAELGSERSRTDSVIRLLRHSICRQSAEDCP